MTNSNEPLNEPETNIDNPGIGEPGIEREEFPVEDPDTENEIIEDDDEDIPLVDATENRR